MSNTVNIVQQRKAAKRIRATLVVEHLESRALLAGLINVGDSIIRVPESARVDFCEVSTLHEAKQDEPTHDQPEATDQPEASDQLEATDQLEASRQSETTGQCVVQGDVWSPDEDWIDGMTGLSPGTEEANDGEQGYGSNDDSDSSRDGENAETKSELNEGDEKESSLLPGFERPSKELAPLGDPANGSSFIVPVVISASAVQLKSSRADVPPLAPSNLNSSSFYYFRKSYESVVEETATLRSQPLASEAMQDTFFSYSLINDSKLTASSPDANLPSKPAIHLGASDPKVSSPRAAAQMAVAKADHQHLIRKAEVAIEKASEILRSADASEALVTCDAPTNKVISDELISNPAAIASLAKVESTDGEPDKNASFGSKWHYVLFGMISLFVSTRSSVPRGGDDASNESVASVRPTKTRRNVKRVG